MKKENFLKMVGVPALAALIVFGGVLGFVAARSFLSDSGPFQNKSSASENSVWIDKNDGGASDKGNPGPNAKNAPSNNDAVNPQPVPSKPTGDFTLDEAKRTAQDAYPNYRIISTETEREYGTIIYEIKMSGESGNRLEVKVDSATGKIIVVERESHDDD